MEQKISIILITLLIVMPVISADLIIPGTHIIDINNQIKNINDFQDYVFVSYGSIGPGMCPIKVIENDGKIERYYKFCSISVYSIPKSEFNENILTNENTTQVEEYFNSPKIQKIIESISTSKTLSISNPTKEINNYYTIDLNKVKDRPDQTKIVWGQLFYFYIIVPIIALLIILFIIFRRKNAAR